MDFSIDKPIFRQIVDLCHRRILEGKWALGQKVPSVREMAVELSVNTRTVLSAFEVLESEGVVMTKRGLGYFLTEDAKEKVLKGRREEFFNDKLPSFITEMKTLGLTPGDVIEIVNQSW